MSIEDIPNKASVCLIVLQYNKLDLTRQCLLSIVEKEEGGPLVDRFILADNASTEEGVAEQFSWAKSIISNIETVQFSENYGFADAHNRLIEGVNEDYVLLLNNDTLLVNDAITQILRCAFNDKVDVATGILYNQDGSVQPNTKGFYFFPEPLKRINIWIQKKFRTLVKSNAKSCQFDPIVYANGAFLLIKTALFKKVGGFDKQYFMYTEDLDLMIKLNKIGATMRAYHAPKVVHLGGASSAQVWDEYEKVRFQISQGNRVIIGHYGKIANYTWAIVYGFCAITIFTVMAFYKGGILNVRILWRKAVWRLWAR